MPAAGPGYQGGVDAFQGGDQDVGYLAGEHERDGPADAIVPAGYDRFSLSNPPLPR